MNKDGPRRLYTDVQWHDTPSDADKSFIESEVKLFLDAIAPGRNKLLALSIEDNQSKDEIVNAHLKGELEF